jgi:hypothetical protein
MKKITVIVAGALLVIAGSARAQLSVRLQCERDTFLLYEAVQVGLELQNYSGRTIELTSEGGKSWLSFVVTDESGNMVAPTDEPMPKDSVLLPAGETRWHMVDLLPLYELRRRGNYKVQAYIASRGITAITRPVRFTLMQGRELGSVTRGLPPRVGETDQYRTYVLLTRSTQEGNLLYVLVRDDANQRVFEMIPLGKYLPTMKPVTKLDREGTFHVLLQNGPRAFAYAAITSEGRLHEQKGFTDYMSLPELIEQNGEIRVVGGEQVYPKLERILEEEEETPPPPPPPPKKRPWWKIWGSWSSAPNTNAPALKKKP